MGTQAKRCNSCGVEKFFGCPPKIADAPPYGITIEVNARRPGRNKLCVENGSHKWDTEDLLFLGDTLEEAKRHVDMLIGFDSGELPLSDPR